MLVPNLHWVVIEDSETKTELVTKLLENSGISFTHLNVATPKNWKLKTKEPRWSKPRGVLQRNVALDWIRENLSEDSNDGVLYFLDDDNSYALEIFEEMRSIKGVGVWPVGLVGGLMVERPNVNSKGKVVGWHVAWSQNRPFAIDMAGFAINLKLFLRTPEGRFAFEVEKGYQETELLKHFVKSLDELEVRADNCTKVYVWHTRTETPALREEKLLLKQKKKPSNDGIEV
jgi:galactosylgalactosylxylosylprotein 3-beta-glucuronosyltransferase 3